jgi:hypothetical protein
MTSEEYKNIGLLGRLLFWEKKIYNKALWISHTNEDRLKLFVNDTGISNDNRLHTLPNFPSKHWGITSTKGSITTPIKIVYVGAIGLESLYVKEFAEWVERQNGKVIWDIYTQQNDYELKEFLQKSNSKHVIVKGFLSYHQLPEVLSQYSVGVILYKGFSPNFIYNAPNKLFEYLACGLDVWFPRQLKGAYPFIKTNSYPKVINIDFENLEAMDIEVLIDRKTIPYIPSSYYYEIQYQTLRNELIQ